MFEDNTYDWLRKEVGHIKKYGRRDNKPPIPLWSRFWLPTEKGLQFWQFTQLPTSFFHWWWQPKTLRMIAFWVSNCNYITTLWSQQQNLSITFDQYSKKKNWKRFWFFISFDTSRHVQWIGMDHWRTNQQPNERFQLAVIADRLTVKWWGHHLFWPQRCRVSVELWAHLMLTLGHGKAHEIT